MTSPDPNRPASQPAAPAQQQRSGATVDIEKLAEKVYRLMQAELRLERARGARASRRTPR